MTTDAFDAQAFPRRIYGMLVLGSLAGGPKHGYQIALDVEERSGGWFVLQYGTLYPILHRLEAAGMIEGEWSGGDGERRRKVYDLTAEGRVELSQGSDWVQRVLRRLSHVLEAPDERSGTRG
jgi:DNA-binding PadR family transcriptional regulator